MTNIEAAKKYAIEMILKGMSRESVLTYLTKNEHTREEAEAYYQQLEELKPQLIAHARAEAQESGETSNMGTILWGLLWLLGGAVITFGTYNAGGSSYVIAYGPMIYGFITIIRGLAK